jgi:vancomycin permeability regulator SanA
LVPADNSFVLIQQTSDATAYVTMVSKVDQVYLAGDVNGGLVKIDNLKQQYDTMIAAFKAAIAAGFGALAGLDGGASLSAFNSAAASIQNLNKTTLENTTVKHGNG